MTAKPHRDNETSSNNSEMAADDRGVISNDSKTSSNDSEMTVVKAEMIPVNMEDVSVRTIVRMRNMSGVAKRYAGNRNLMVKFVRKRESI